MAGKEENRIFVGGLSWDVTERQLEHAFGRYGKILECQVVFRKIFYQSDSDMAEAHFQFSDKIIACGNYRAQAGDLYGFGICGIWCKEEKIMMERDTGRPRGFGFITFADRRSMEDAIKEMHGREIGDRIISVNKAQPKMGGDDVDHGYRGGYSSGGRGSYGVGDRVGQDDCFKCGRPGHWARDCPLAGGGRGRGRGSFSSRPRFGGAGGHGDRLSGERDRYLDDRYDGGRYGDRDRFDTRDYKYGSRDRYASDRYPTSGDRFASDRYSGGSDNYPQNGYGKERGYDRYSGPRGGGDRYGSGMPARDEGRNYRGRPGPYDRPSRGARPSSFDRY